MGLRIRPKGTFGAWKVVGTHRGPPGSGLHATLFVQEDGIEECADIEEVVGISSKRRLARILGDHAHVRGIAWMEGLVAGRSPVAPAVLQPKVKRPVLQPRTKKS